ncbi:MAG: hypothetical protein Q7S82_03770, partial [bacterium]|nr:hypothetical protein [bacterium]
LTPSTTYYYRAVSHASLAISREYSFTTLGVKEIGKIEGEVEVPPGEETLAGEEILAQGEITELPKELTGEKSSKEATEETMALQETEKKSFDKIFAAGGLLAAISAAPLNLTVILILAGVVIIGLLILRLTRKRKIKS